MLTQQELLEKLKELGTPITSQTLRTRERQGLVTPAYRGKDGKPGRSVFYPDKCLYEHYAASKIISSSRLRLTAEQVKDARNEFLRFLEEPPLSGYLNRPEEELLNFRLGEHWFVWYLYALVKKGKGAFAARVMFRDFSEVEDGLFYELFTSTDKNILTVPVNEWHEVYGITVCKNEFIQKGTVMRWVPEGGGIGPKRIDFPEEGIIYIDAGEGPDFECRLPF